ncbi:MAG: hypothetical protein MJ232_07370 [archaeon]|nr:hypothetical protein [archaeon]
MARPIEPTPTLKGEDAKAFLKKMSEPPSKKELEAKKRLESIKRSVYF